MLPGEYTDFGGVKNEYYQYVEHFVKRSMRTLICSKTYELVDGEVVATGGKCLACDEMDNGAEDVSWRQCFAFNGIHLDYYHLVPVFDDDGKPIKYSRGKRQGEQVKRKQLCEGRRCKMCKDKLEKVFGKKVHWTVGSGHLKQLGGIVVEIEKECVCGGQLEVATHECGECGDIVVDMNETDLDDKDIAKITKRRHKCRADVDGKACGYTGYLIPQHDCDNCDDPEPLSIFDCDLDIKRQGENAQSTVMVPRWTQTELSDDLKEMAKPYVFSKVFAADPFKIQAKILKIRNPYGDDEPSKDKGSADDHADDYEDDADLS
jgi:hypothetical protein